MIRTSASACVATENASRSDIPDEYVRTGRSKKSPSSANSRISGSRRRISRAGQAEQGCVDPGVLAAGELGVEAHAQLEDRGDESACALTVPEVGCVVPATIFSSVDLPAPFSPINPSARPARQREGDVRQAPGTPGAAARRRRSSRRAGPPARAPIAAGRSSARRRSRPDRRSAVLRHRRLILAERELAAAAEEVVAAPPRRRRSSSRRRAIVSPPSSSATVCVFRSPTVEVLVVVLAAEHRLRGRRDVEVLEGPRAHQLAASQLSSSAAARARTSRSTGRLRILNGLTSQPFGPKRARICLDVAPVASSSSPSTTIAVSSASVARPHRVHVGEHAGEILRAVQLEVPLGVERRQVDADVAEAARAPRAARRARGEVRRVGQDRDRQSALEEDPAPLLEERIDRRLVVVRQEDDDAPCRRRRRPGPRCDSKSSWRHDLLSRGSTETGQNGQRWLQPVHVSSET